MKVKNIFDFNKKYKIPEVKEVKIAIKSFSRKEYYVFIFIFLICSISAIWLFFSANASFMVERPRSGGTLTEGIIGSPRFINPVLAITDSDKDLTSLIYSGLIRKTSDGKLIKDLASDYKISEDGLTYTFTLRDNIYFQNKKPINADDIIFTINQIQDIKIKSPKKINWEGVKVNKINEKEIQFILKQPYSSFIENATIGILPKYLWEKNTPEQFSLSTLNINGIGSGPYKISKIKKNQNGIPTYYELSAFKKFNLGKPLIEKIILKFYANEDELYSALLNGKIEQANSLSPQKALLLKEKGFRIENKVLPRIFGLFFNPNESSIFTDKNVVKAFNKAINKNNIIEKVLFGYGNPINSPAPPFFINQDNNQKEDYDGSIEEAKEILEDNGWKLNTEGIMEKEKIINIKKKQKEITPLKFSISTSDTSELKNAANLIKEDLKKIGAEVDLKIFEIGDLNQNVIRPRKYEALFFGQIINYPSDLFAFWHSSQRNDPGLNIAMYANTKNDKNLEEMLSLLDAEKIEKKFKDFEQEIEKDAPAIFIYSPNFIYATSKEIKNLNLSNLLNASDRFGSVYQWYKSTEKIWKIFTK